MLAFHSVSQTSYLHICHLIFFFLVFPLDNFTFNPENLNLNLILSEDHRQVTSVSIWPFKCCNNGILGSKCFSSGKHYWEVDVSEKKAWTLGVYTRKRTLRFDVRQRKGQPNGYHRYKPQNGYWVIGLQHGSKYSIFEDSSNCDPTVLNPFVATPLHRVGIFLDCEEGTVSFLNVTNHGSLIYKFSQCCFSQPAYPYFNPWDCPAPMTLCPLNSWVFSFSSVSALTSGLDAYLVYGPVLFRHLFPWSPFCHAWMWCIWHHVEEMLTFYSSSFSQKSLKLGQGNIHALCLPYFPLSWRKLTKSISQ